MENLIKFVADFLAFAFWKLLGNEGQVGAFTYDQITAITNDNIMKMSEGIFTGSRTLSRFRSKQELEEGGNKILAPLMTSDDTDSTGGFYSPRDALSLNEYDGISASQHDWKYLQESVVIYKADIAKNGGNFGVLKLIDKKTRQCELAFRQRMLKGILSDGTVATGSLSSDQFVGFDAIIAASGSYGGFGSTDLATWVSYVDTNSGADRALTQAILDKAFDQANEEGVGGPSLGLMDKNVFTKFKGLLTGIQRTTRESTLSGLGHKGTSIVYNGIDYLVENQMKAQTIFMIDEEHAKLHVHKDHNMRRQSIKDLETADALLERLFLYGNIVASERKFHSEINDITV